VGTPDLGNPQLAQQQAVKDPAFSRKSQTGACPR
jgi:hypothetical protein